jgi:murein DD-endopeptidase MepM/ murein hydrolase activator NlpD
MQQTYEDRIGALRVHLDRLANQNVLDQDALEKRMSDLIARQGQLESRQAILTRLSDAASSGLPQDATAPLMSVPRSSDAAQGTGSYPPEPPKPAPVPETFGLRLRGAEAKPSSAGSQRTTQQAPTAAPIRDRLSQLQQSLANVNAKQMQALDGFLRTAETRAVRLREAIRSVGLNPDAVGSSQSDKRAVGGPLVPFPEGAPGGLFETMVDRVETSLAQVERLDKSVDALPFGRPMPGAIDLTSGFGYRIDPFTRGPALHTGLDFRGEYGALVRSTGAGQVLNAEHAGGYGNMVEIDHGNGVTTRYAHLSSLLVSPGQTVAAGAILGRVGSTGRSTGAHLHYETRVDGEAVDPQRFLRAGVKMASASQLP